MSIKLQHTGTGIRNIIHNGEFVGTMMQNAGEVRVEFHGQFAARFKHRRPVTNAKDFITFALKNIGAQKYLDELNASDRPTPLGVLMRRGYENPNMKNAKKEWAR